MNKKTIGYILSIAGIAGLALSNEKIRGLIKISLPEQLTPQYLMFLSVILILSGLFLSFKKKTKQKTVEVPIYEGNNIVGYRRH